jgi:hypothetical protein
MERYQTIMLKKKELLQRQLQEWLHSKHLLKN